MKILVIADRLDSFFGGLEQYVVTKINKLSDRGHEITLYTNAITDYGISFINKNINIITPWSENVFDDIKDYIPSLISTNPFTSMVRAYEISIKYNIPLISTMHGLYNYGFDNSEFGRKFGSQVKKIIAVDHAVEDILIKSINCDKSKLTTIYNSIDINKFYPNTPSQELINKLKINTNWKTLVVVSRFQDGKEIPVNQLIEILPSLSNVVNGLNVVIVGTGRFLGDIKSKSINYKSDLLNLIFTGAVTDVYSYLNLSDFVCASARTAIEAIACNKNVFQMGIGKWGVLIDKDNYKDTLFNIKYYTNYTNEQLLNHFIWMLTQTKSINSVTDGLCDTLRKECSIDNMINKLENIYLEAIN